MFSLINIAFRFMATTKLLIVLITNDEAGILKLAFVNQNTRKACTPTLLIPLEKGKQNINFYAYILTQVDFVKVKNS